MKTIVYVRTNRTPVVYYETEVLYDAWGQPYINPYGKNGAPRTSATVGVKVLRTGGKTDDWVYETQWKHKSGPEITWPDPNITRDW